MGPLIPSRLRPVLAQLLALLLALSPAGCVTLGAATLWGAITDERSVLEQAADARITTRIRLAILRDDLAALDAVSVFSHRGRVVLVGAAPTGSTLPRRLVAVARRVEGVRRVDTYFVATRPSRYRDLVMGLEARSNIIGDLQLRSAQVDVAVVGGHVVLTGLVDTPDKITRAVGHARAVDGVVAVTSLIGLVEPERAGP